MPVGVRKDDLEDAALLAALSVKLKQQAPNPSFEETWKELGWEPQEKQQAAIDAVRSGAYFLFYGGAAGGGKSNLLRHLLVAYARHHPNSRVALMRRTYPELRDTHEIPLAGLPKAWGRYVKDDKLYLLNNGSILQLAYCDTDLDVVKFKGTEYEVIALDEAVDFTPYQIVYLNSRIRSVYGYPTGMWFGTNPGGVAHLFLKKTFVDPAPPQTPFQAIINRATFPAVFVPAKLHDNQKLVQNDPGYERNLDAQNEQDRRALKDGDWDIFAGQFFKSWNRDLHVVEPFAVPDHWRKWGGLDWGHAAPLSFGLYAMDPLTRRRYRIRELYEARLTDSEACERIWGIIGDAKVDAIYADPSMWAKKGADDSLSTAERYISKGLPLVPANNDRPQGWRRMRDLLEKAPDGLPHFQVFSNCTEFVRTVPALIHDKRKPEDLNTDGEDHCADECRYSLLARQSEFLFEEEPEREKSSWEYV